MDCESRSVPTSACMVDAAVSVKLLPAVGVPVSNPVAISKITH